MKRPIGLAVPAAGLFFLSLALVSAGLGDGGTELAGEDLEPAPSPTATLSLYRGSPLSFEPNEGQSAPSVRFLSHGPGYTLFLTRTQLVLSVKSGAAAVVRMMTLGANAEPDMVGLEPLPGRSNYLSGRPEDWHTDIPHYAKVACRQIYPGIDLVLYGNEGDLEFDFVVSPGADPDLIRLGFEGIEDLYIDENGDLIAELPGGELIHHAPVIYQQIAGTTTPVAGGYVLEGDGEIGFRVAEHDRAYALVIDPVLAYSTYLGSDIMDFAEGIAVDGSEYAYVTGRVESSSFPTAGLTIGAPATWDVLISKFSLAGNDLVFSTFVSGGSGHAITVDDIGRPSVAGSTGSTNFTTYNAYQKTYGGGARDAILLKLDPAGGKLIYSTFLGGSDADYARGVALDSAGQAYVVGETSSTDFRTLNAYQRDLKGAQDAFIAKYDFVGGKQYSTFLGGSSDEDGADIAASDTGDAIVTGTTESSDFHTKNAYTGSLGASQDAFVARLGPSGGLSFSTYLGGKAQWDAGHGIAVDGSGAVYVVGLTHSSDFPTVAAFDGTHDGACRNFVAKLAANGSALLFATYLGGSSALYDDCGWENDVALGPTGDVYVVGDSESIDFPTVAPIFGANNGGRDATVTRFDASGQSLVFSTYLGGTLDDEGSNIAVDASGNAYVLGATRSTDFPTVMPYQATKAPDRDMFVVKIEEGSLDFFIAATPEVRESTAAPGIFIR